MTDFRTAETDPAPLFKELSLWRGVRPVWGLTALVCKVLEFMTFFAGLHAIHVAYAGDWQVHNQMADTFATFLLGSGWMLEIISLILALIGLFRDANKALSIVALLFVPFGFLITA